MNKIFNLLTKPYIVIPLAIILFSAGTAAGLWQIGFFKKPQVKNPKVEKAESLGARTEAEELQKTLAEIDTHGKEIAAREQKLDEREAKIRKMENDLALQKAALDKFADHIGEMRKELDSHLIEVDDTQEAGIAHMAKMYSAMAPINASKIIATLPESQAVQILGKMKMSVAVKIIEVWLNQGPELADKATRVTNLMRVVMGQPSENAAP